jgi:hypothetical protein
LTVNHFDVQRGGVELDAAWTKNRKPGFQYMTESLIERLSAYVQSGAAVKAYKRSHRPCDKGQDIPVLPLLYVPTHTARDLGKDLKVAGIPKETPEGKVDFHAFRVSCLTAACEAGASVKEAQALGRHATPAMTMNVYARTRDNGMRDLAERMGEAIATQGKCVTGVHVDETTADGREGNAVEEQQLEAIGAVDSNGFDSRRLHENPLFYRGFLARRSTEMAPGGPFWTLRITIQGNKIGAVIVMTGMLSVPVLSARVLLLSPATTIATVAGMTFHQDCPWLKWRFVVYSGVTFKIADR